MQTGQLAQALDGFRQSLALAQQNKAAREKEALLREVHNANIAEAEARTRKINTPFDAANDIGNTIFERRASGQQTGFSDLDPVKVLQLGDQAPILSPFLSDDDRFAAQLSAGNIPTETSRFSIADRDAQLQADRDLEIDKIFAEPVSTAAGAVTTLGAGDPRGRQVFGRDTAATAKGSIINDLAAGQEVTPFAAATVLPQSGTVDASGGTSFGPTLPFGALGKSQFGKVQEDLIAQERAVGNLKRYREVIQGNPTSVGAVGNVRGAIQDVNTLAQSTAEAFGFQDIDAAADAFRNDIAANIARGGGDLSAESLALFDPTIPQIELLSNIVAYEFARSLDPGGRTSDRDIRAAKDAIGNPRSWLQNRESLTARVDEAINTVERNRAVNQSAIGLPGASPFSPPAAPTDTRTDEDLLRQYLRPQ